jgi:hypothetical protein
MDSSLHGNLFFLIVGAAEGCDLLILFFGGSEKIKRSQPSAAPTGPGARIFLIFH